MRVGVVLTVRRPKGAPARAVPADGYRDLDHLIRAIDDGLCPKNPGQFRVLASDMRIVGFDFAEKSHPRPFHTHPLALPQPGAIITIRDGRSPVTLTKVEGQDVLLVPIPRPVP